MNNNRDWKPLPAVLTEAIKEYDDWAYAHLREMDVRNHINKPLYHYTDAAGLEGIIKNQEVWFTSCAHLNDPTEIEYGMSIASELLSEIGAGSDPRIKMFCDMANDLFTHRNMRRVFDFFIASFSRDGDDLGQWRGYGDNGRGFALGLAPRLFHTIDKPSRSPHENVFVAPMVYGKPAGRKQHLPAIEKAIRVAASVVEHYSDLMQDYRVGMPFFDALAKALIASELIFNSLTIKHEAYRNEQEVRLIIVGEREKLRPYVATRPRHGDVVPFIKSGMLVQSKGGIADIVIGPSAAPGAEDGLCMLLQSFSDNVDSLVRRSTIPYRAG